MRAKQMKCLMLPWIAMIVMTLTPYVCSAFNNQRESQIFHQPSKKHLNPDLRTARGLVLSNHPQSHLISLQKWELTGLPNLDSLSLREKLQLAITEFKAARRNSKKLQGYSKTQIEGFLGRAFMLLGTEMLSLAERHTPRSRTFKSNARSYFESSIWYYRKAAEGDPTSLRYYWAQDSIQAILASGDLNRALQTIRDLEQKKITPNFGVDHGLLRMKGEILWIMGRYLEAGMTYEEWIKRGNTETKLSPESLIYERLLYLKETTGHPNNFFPKSTSKGSSFP